MSYDHYQARVQELEKAGEDKENEVLRGLKDSKNASIQGVRDFVCCKCNMISAKNEPAAPPDASGSTASQINDLLSSRKGKILEFVGTSDLNLVDTTKNISSSMDKKTSEFSQIENANVNPNLGSQINEEETDQRSYHPQLKTCNLIRKRAAERTTSPVNVMPSTATVKNTSMTSAVPGDKCMPLVIEDTAQCEPVLNIRRESSSHLPLNKPGNDITDPFSS